MCESYSFYKLAHQVPISFSFNNNGKLFKQSFDILPMLLFVMSNEILLLCPLLFVMNNGLIPLLITKSNGVIRYCIF